MSGEPKPKTPDEQFVDFKNEIRQLAKTLDASGIWEMGDMDKSHLDAWAAAIPENETSRSQLVQYCRQHTQIK